jgi:D-alanyl-D-alanine carboxypeptidase
MVTSTVVSTATVQPAARPNSATPGPAGGAACSVNGDYFDEGTDGLAADVVVAWAEAQNAATAAGVTLCLHDGKRSSQQQLDTYEQYVRDYGEAAAQQLVLPPDKSAHVAGYAIDVQPAAADSWLEATNGAYGFCRMYDNEIWHFEYADTFRVGCPPRRAQPIGW